MKRKIELLAPAGGMEQLKTAIHFGADSVYAGGPGFGLRANAANFTIEGLKEAADYVHERGKKLYITVNAVMHQYDIKRLPAYFEKLYAADVDAVIVSDPGALMLARKSGLRVHISTQASVCNAESVKFWRDAGASRVVLARELSLDEIADIKREAGDVELETFVHGAMCMSYSGRCLISAFLSGRDANRGDCSHPCRWKYRVQEEKRGGMFIDIDEDGRGSYIFNSKDLKMIRHLEELKEAGVGCFKIEGRMKSAYYVGTVVGAYRRTMDNPKSAKEFEPELEAVSHRPYSTGFFFGPAQQDCEGGEYISTHEFVGVVRGHENGNIIAEQRNRFFRGDELELLRPGKEAAAFVASDLTDIDGNPLESAPHPQQMLKIGCPFEAEPLDIIRKRK
ncbi:MAG: peptidase U32 family protein [Christensenellales bacterium]|jgi:putative protease